MKSLVFDGSLNTRNTYNICQSFLKRIKGEIVYISDIVFPCYNCGRCIETGKCVLKDVLREKLTEEYDYIFIFSSVYFFGINSKAKAFLDRLYSYHNAETTNLVLVTVSGSETEDLFSGVNVIKEQFALIKEYCGYKSFKHINFVTYDELIDIDEKIIDKFIEELYYETEKEN